MTVFVGTYSPFGASRSGGTFSFALCDFDGLPVVDESFNGTARLRDFKAILHRCDPTQAACVPILPHINLKMRYVGTEVKLDAQRPPRSLNGRVAVEVVLAHRGQHQVTIAGPEPNGSSSLVHVPWVVNAEGVCNEYDSAPFNGTSQADAASCACKPGYEMEPTTETCTVCGDGLVKDWVGDYMHIPPGQEELSWCVSCVELSRRRRSGGVDPNRREVQGPDASSHDQLLDCGCSQDFFFRVESSSLVSVQRLLEDCPSIYSYAWVDARSSITQTYQLACSRFDSASHEFEVCVSQACRRSKLESWKTNELAWQGLCTYCDNNTMT
eukprot:5169042-Prymnesium_polylepis.1